MSRGRSETRSGGSTDLTAEARRRIAGLVQAEPGSVRTWRRRVLALPPEVAVPELAAALERHATWVEYQRVAYTLARIGSERALAVLESDIRDDHRYAGLAIRAMELAGSPQCLNALTDLLATRKRRLLRRIAMALARAKYVPALLSILRHEYLHRASMAACLHELLVQFGRPQVLVPMVLADERLAPEETVETLLALETVPRYLGRTNARMLLDRYVQRASGQRSDRASAVAKMYRDRTTLLRPSEKADDITLLRPASGADRTPTERLLTPSSTEATVDQEATSSPGLLGRIWNAVKEALDGDG